MMWAQFGALVLSGDDRLALRLQVVILLALGPWTTSGFSCFESRYDVSLALIRLFC